MSWDVGAWVINTLRKSLAPAFTGSVPIVKSVQRGNTTATSVTISEVNPDKCIVLVNSQYASPNSVWAYGDSSSREIEESDLAVLSRPTGLTATTLTLTANTAPKGSTDYKGGWDGWASTKGTVTWQVIEFY